MTKGQALAEIFNATSQHCVDATEENEKAMNAAIETARKLGIEERRIQRAIDVAILPIEQWEESQYGGEG
jgi:hypothetical protein